MTNAGTIFLTYGIVLGGMGVYAASLVFRGRRLGRQLPDEDKPWT